VTAPSNWRSERWRLVCATANPHKVEEMAAILGDAVHLLPRPSSVPDVVEDAPTLEGNARLKASAIAAATGLPALADDTGLEVDALGGAPGVHSARYAGEPPSDTANVVKLLAELVAVPPGGRTARFRTVVMVRWPDGREVAAEGVVSGRIAAAPAGSTGFGYDPVFIPDDDNPGARTFAQLGPGAKHAVSHRGRALRALVAALPGD
jgi:XTP/dITP diphosphohydrolase